MTPSRRTTHRHNSLHLHVASLVVHPLTLLPPKPPPVRPTYQLLQPPSTPPPLRRLLARIWPQSPRCCIRVCNRRFRVATSKSTGCTDTPFFPGTFVSPITPYISAPPPLPVKTVSRPASPPPPSQELIVFGAMLRSVALPPLVKIAVCRVSSSRKAIVPPLTDPG